MEDKERPFDLRNLHCSRHAKSPATRPLDRSNQVLLGNVGFNAYPLFQSVHLYYEGAG